MSIRAPRAYSLVACAAPAVALASVAFLPLPASAQSASGPLGILIECAKIDEPSARLACYDNNMRNVSGIARNTVPGSVAVSGAGAVVGNSATATAGFGGESVRRNRETAGMPTQTAIAARPAPTGQGSITATISAARLREPGKYLLTLEDQSQWLFSDTVRNDFTPPRKGEKVVIERGSLGSYLARVENQEPVRVRRVR